MSTYDPSKDAEKLDYGYANEIFLPKGWMSKICKDFFGSADSMQQNSLMTNLEFGKQIVRDRKTNSMSKHYWIEELSFRAVFGEVVS